MKRLSRSSPRLTPNELQLIDEIRRNQDQLVALTSELIRIPTVNPPGDVSTLAAFVESYFQERRIPIQRYEAQPGRVSLIAELQGRPGRNLAFNGHMDVVPAGDLKNWKVDPFAGEIADGKCWGRGAADMKSKVAAAMFVTSLLATGDQSLSGTWQVVLVPDEETGGQHGTKWLLEKGLLQADAVIVGEGAGKHYGIANKGCLSVNLTARGRSAHASRPFEGENAVEKLAASLPVLHRLEEWRPPLPTPVTDIIERSKSFHRAKSSQSGVDVDQYIQSLARITVNVGAFRGGTARNVVADGAVAELDLRYPPGVSGAEVQQRLAELLSSDPTGAGVELEVISDFEPFYQALDSEIVQLAATVLRDVGVNEDPQPIFKGSFNDSRHLSAHGIPCVVLGHDGSGGHVPNESCTVSELVDTACVYAVLASRFLSRE